MKWDPGKDLTNEVVQTEFSEQESENEFSSGGAFRFGYVLHGIEKAELLKS